MVKKGELDKYGKKIAGVTPADWNKNYVDYKDEGEATGATVSTQPEASGSAAPAAGAAAGANGHNHPAHRGEAHATRLDSPVEAAIADVDEKAAKKEKKEKKRKREGDEAGDVTLETVAADGEKKVRRASVQAVTRPDGDLFASRRRRSPRTPTATCPW